MKNVLLLVHQDPGKEARLRAALDLMGAFGHSRIREALLGGVTRDMLSEAPLPLVLAS